MKNEHKKNETQILREYIQIKKTQQQMNVSKLRDLLAASSLTINEAKPFYHLAELMEKETIA